MYVLKINNEILPKLAMNSNISISKRSLLQCGFLGSAPEDFRHRTVPNREQIKDHLVEIVVKTHKDIRILPRTGFGT